MTSTPPADTRLRQPWLNLARVVWLCLTVPVFALYVADIPYQMSEGEGDPISTILWQIVMPLGFVAVSLLIVWRRPDDWMALLTSFALLTMGCYLLTGTNQTWGSLPGWNILNGVLVTASAMAFIGLLFLFPDGRFAPRWSWIVTLAAALAIGLTYFASLNYPAAYDFSYFPFTLFALIGLAAQIYRYLRVSTSIQRQQAKWVIVGFGGPTLVVIIYFTLILPVEERIMASGWSILLFAGMAVSLAWLFPIALMIAILRYRLWDIDIVIRRTLQYSVLSGLLALLYFGFVVALQSLLQSAIGNPKSEIVIILSTLALAALFNPLRRRVQDAIDRRFYRKKYDAAKVIAEFAATCRDETDLDKLTARLVEVVQETMQPENTSLWLKQ